MFRKTFLTALAVLCTAALLLPLGLHLPPLVAKAAGAVSVTFTNPITTTGGVSLVASGMGDSTYSLTTVQGKSAIVVEGYAYFHVTDDVLRNSEKLTVTLTLLDTGKRPMFFQYCSTESAYETLHIQGTGSGKYITVELQIENAALSKNAQNYQSAFRFGGGTVHAVSVSAPATERVSVNFTNPITTTGGISVPASGHSGSDNVYTFTTVQGRSAVNIDQYVYFLVTEPTLLNTTDMTFSVTFLDEGSTPILLQYRSTNSAYELIHIHRHNTGEIVTVEVPIENAAFNESKQNLGAVFRLNRGTVFSLSIKDGCTDDTLQAPPAFAPQTAQNNIIGKGVTGYQVWFRANESNPQNGWGHWTNGGNLPVAGNVHTEMYPYTDDYVTNGATLHQTGLANLGNGNPSVLFNSPDEAVIKTHMQWMQEYDIDGAAVQRFYSACDPTRSDRHNTLMTIQEQAEAHDRLFYVMYDFSHSARTDDEIFLRTVKLDFIYNVEETGVASSPNYGHADGKPVVCLWGLHGDPASEYFNGPTATALIEWFQARGYYVIGGSPDNEYDKAAEEYLEPFTKLDMLSMWTVGRYGSSGIQGWYNHHIPIDIAFCEKYDIDYQPVIWSGFGWSNMKNNGLPNSHPRLAGDFLWDQAYILKNEYGIESVYFAMWDEYDEGTAIMKAASDYFEIPTDQYFLTYAADGWWLSNDYYLRAAEAIIDMMQGKTALRADIDIPHSLGPVYWRNSFESREATYTVDGGETIQTSSQRLDVCLNNPLWLANANLANATAAIVTDRAHSGEYAFRFAATANADYQAVFKIADTAITASQPLELSYSLYAANENGRNVYVDLLFSDGTRLSDTNVAATATHGISGEWVQVTLPLGPAADGKTVVGVAVGYHGAVGAFDAFIDDILLEHGSDSHRWDAGRVVEKATVLQRGVREYACQNSGCTATAQEWYAHDPATCDHSDAEYRAGIEPTCTESGIAAGLWCFACNALVQGGETLPPHATEYRDEIPPTADTVGHTAGVWCLVCEKYIQGGEEIPVPSVDETIVNGVYYRDGQKVPYAGLVKVDGYYYYVIGNSKVKTGRYAISTVNNTGVPKGIYYFFEDGRMNTELGVYEGHYYNADGRSEAYAGLIEWNGAKYYVNDGGKVTVGRYFITKLNGLVPKKRAYTFFDDGRMLEDTRIYKDGFYYVDGIRTPYAGMVEYEGQFYYVSDHGAYVTDTVQIAATVGDSGKVKNGRYCFGADGTMQFNVVKDGRFFGADGMAPHYAGVVEADGKFYFVNGTNGVLTVNKTFRVIPGKTNGLIPAGEYTADANGVLTAVG